MTAFGPKETSRSSMLMSASRSKADYFTQSVPLGEQMGQFAVAQIDHTYTDDGV